MSVCPSDKILPCGVQARLHRHSHGSLAGTATKAEGWGTSKHREGIMYSIEHMPVAAERKALVYRCGLVGRKK